MAHQIVGTEILHTMTFGPLRGSLGNTIQITVVWFITPTMAHNVNTLNHEPSLPTLVSPMAQPRITSYTTPRPPTIDFTMNAADDEQDSAEDKEAVENEWDGEFEHVESMGREHMIQLLL
jgi:hypothetical protein